MTNKKALLVILDGWGSGREYQGNAVYRANKKNWDSLLAAYPSSQLLASGLSVGLPEGVIGNSEVGHLNLGAGRVVYQDLVRINKACEDGSLGDNTVLRQAFSEAQEPGRSLHFIGLVSDAGVHAMDAHLYKLCDLAKENGITQVFVHAITDGRDTDPRSGLRYIERLTEHLKGSVGTLSSIIGRYYAMDRDKRWERIKIAYDLLVKGTGKQATDMLHALRESYEAGVTDEFVLPIIKNVEGRPVGLVKPDDVVICFNYRTERLRQLTEVLTQEDRPDQEMAVLPLHYYTLTSYNDDYQGVRAIFPKEKVVETLGEEVSKAGLKQLRLAETEKYAHVTFFFSGGQQEAFLGEDRVLVPSPSVATYDQKPEMSAYQVKDELVSALQSQDYAFICVNFANPDMVGHTGVYPAIVRAVEVVDECLGEIVPVARKAGYDIIVLADHGNAEHAVNEDGTPNTAHSLNPVPCLLISDDQDKISSGVLADVAPTILEILGLKKPASMTGKSLLN